MSIPLLLHQTYKSSQLPAKLAAFQASWQQHNPEWDYRFWQDDDIEAFISTEYPEFLATYKAYPQHIMRIDAFRYFVLYHYGGIYADIDFECLRPLSEIMTGRELMLIPEPPSHLNKPKARLRGLEQIVSNAFIAAAPRHPFWAAVTQRLVAESTKFDVLDATGPFFLTSVHQEFQPSIPLMPPQYFSELTSPERAYFFLARRRANQNPAAAPYAQHHWMGSWWRHGALTQLAATLVAQLKELALQRVSFNYRLRDYLVKSPLKLRQLSTAGPPSSSQLLNMERGRITGTATYSLAAGAALLQQSTKLPLVSALLVTKNRPELAWRAWECFQAQTYPNKELVIIDEDGTELQQKLAKHKLLATPQLTYHRYAGKGNLGRIRNLSLKLAKGEYVCQWDDDDLYHQDRMLHQMTACLTQQAAACFLMRELVLVSEGQRLAVSDYRLWEGSIMVRKDLMFNYAHWKRGEEYTALRSLVRRRKLVLLDLPELYIYNIHGGNTWHNQHMLKLMRNSTQQFSVAGGRAKLHSLAAAYPDLPQLEPTAG